MKINCLFIIIYLLWSTALQGQWRIATTAPDGRILVSETNSPSESVQRSTRSTVEFELRQGYPKVFLTHPALKNFRNVTLADLDGNGSDEIILGVANQFMVLRNDEIWWSKKLSGLARFPAAIGDLENDGIMDIVILTGFNQDDGQVYAFNSRGIEKPGFPVSFGGHWMISSPALADLDGDGQLEIVCSDLDTGLGQVYILRSDGTMYNNQWPVTLPNVPAVTPSVGDIDADGDLDIVINSTREIYAFDQDGLVKPGWPFNNGQTKFSFQSPILTNLDDNEGLEIVTAGHGDLPLYIILDQLGKPLPNWPKQVPERQWTFQPPTVIQYEDKPLILTGRPISTSEQKPMLFAWRPDGSLLPGFPIVKSGGLEGVITVADIDNDRSPEIIFPSNMIDTSGYGFIHAYELDGSGAVAGFPLQMYGWTFLNGATIGDIDGDGKMNLVVLTFTENPGNEPDSAFLYAYNLNTPLATDRVWWPTYKGNNFRNGFLEQATSTRISNMKAKRFKFFPNPVADKLFIQNDWEQIISVQIRNLKGRVIAESFNRENGISVRQLIPGSYFVEVELVTGKKAWGKFVKI